MGGSRFDRRYPAPRIQSRHLIPAVLDLVADPFRFLQASLLIASGYADKLRGGGSISGL